MHRGNQETPELVARRKAAWALDLMCRHVGLGTLSITFDSECDDEWAVLNMNQVRAIIDKRLVAEVYLEGDTAKVVVPDVYDIIRRQHVKDFNPEEKGIRHRTDINFMGDKTPDLVADFPLPAPSKVNFTGPKNPLPRAATHHKPKVQGALSR